MPAQLRPSIDPKRYFESVGDRRGELPERDPVCVYLETTNRCNLLCTTCPRTYEDLEPPADMSWELFTSIVDQLPSIQRAVLHGVGEPMLVKNLPQMVRHLKDRGVYVLFNTNGTVLNEKNGRALIAAELDELRVSLDAANAKSYRAIRGKDYFNRILRNVRAFRSLQELLHRIVAREIIVGEAEAQSITDLRLPNSMNCSRRRRIGGDDRRAAGIRESRS